jgi:hypothetical protein
MPQPRRGSTPIKTSRFDFLVAQGRRASLLAAGFDNPLHALLPRVAAPRFEVLWEENN